MNAPVYAIPPATLRRLENFLDHFERAGCRHQPKAQKVPEIAAFHVKDVDCAGFWCAGCEQVHLQADFGPCQPHCMKPECPYRQSGAILKNCGTVEHASDLTPEPSALGSGQADSFRPIGELAGAVIADLAQRRRDRT